MLTVQRIAREKARNLKGEQHSSAPHKEHAPGWNEHLAVGLCFPFRPTYLPIASMLAVNRRHVANVAVRLGSQCQGALIAYIIPRPHREGEGMKRSD